LAPGWTPDGARITYLNSDTQQIAWKAADGSGAEETLIESSGDLSSWSPDGRQFVMAQGGDIFTVDVPSRTKRPFLTTPFEEATPMLSPNGRWLAYTSDQS
jgi:Tol biopolymer transport system component